MRLIIDRRLVFYLIGLRWANLQCLPHVHNVSIWWHDYLVSKIFHSNAVVETDTARRPRYFFRRRQARKVLKLQLLKRILVMPEWLYRLILGKNFIMVFRESFGCCCYYWLGLTIDFIGLPMRTWSVIVKFFEVFDELVWTGNWFKRDFMGSVLGKICQLTNSILRY